MEEIKMIDLFNLVMFAVMSAYAIVVLYIFGRAVWQWASEPFRIAYDLEQQINELENNN
tara:strand:+ start:139 stop:315 length:177 start_codon:yes stop_codon:yes gene_type:complete